MANLVFLERIEKEKKETNLQFCSVTAGLLLLLGLKFNYINIKGDIENMSIKLPFCFGILELNKLISTLYLC